MEDGKIILLKPEWLTFMLFLLILGILTFPAGILIWTTGLVVAIATFY